MMKRHFTNGLHASNKARECSLNCHFCAHEYSRQHTKLAIKIVWEQDSFQTCVLTSKFSCISPEDGLLQKSCCLSKGDNWSWHMIKDVFMLSSNFPSPGWKAEWQNSKQDGQIVWGAEPKCPQGRRSLPPCPTTQQWKLLVTQPQKASFIAFLCFLSLLVKVWCI